MVCRNVTIYFGRDTTRELVERFYRSLVMGGYLCLDMPRRSGRSATPSR